MPASPEQLQELKCQIMAEIEAKLSQKEESLWRRGQVEIRRLQLEQAQVAGSVGTLQERQTAIVAENQKIRGALLDVTTKFEMVVKEMRGVMREVLRALPPRPPGPAGSGGEGPAGLSPSPSAASTTASEAARNEESSLIPATPSLSTPLSGTADVLGSLWSACERSRRRPEAHTPVPMWHPQRGCDGNLMELSSCPWDAEDALGADGDARPPFCTPPRASPSTAGCVEDVARALPPPASWRGLTPAASPAVLSLASALPSGSAGPASSHAALNTSTGSCSTAASMSMNPSPSLGLKAQRLQLAECLKSKADAASASSAGGAATAAGGTVAPATPAPGARSGSSRGQKAACALATPASPTRSFDFITVELSKEPGCTALGIEVNDSLRVEGVDEDGLVDRHNLRQESDASRVLPGDRIIEVNGVQRDPSMMLLECKVRQRLVFTIVRDVAGLPPAAATATTTCGSTGDGRGSLGGISTLATASGERDGVPSAEPSPMPLEAPPQAPQPQGADEAAEPLAEEAAAAAAALAAGSPQQTRLRPEARVFVPSSAKKEGANVQGPPGLEMCDAPAVAAATVAGAQAGAAEAAGGSSEGRGQAVKRALFR